MEPHLIIGLCLLVLSLFETALVVVMVRHQAGRRDPLRQPALALAAVLAIATLAAGMSYVSEAEGRSIDRFHRITWFAWLALPALGHVSFMLRGRTSGLDRAFTALHYIFWFAVGAIAVGTDLVDAGTIGLLPYVDVADPLELLVRALGGLVSIWVVYQVIEAQRATSGVQRTRVRLFLAGSIPLGVAAVIFGSGLLSLVGLPTDPALTLLFGWPWLGATVFAMSRHRLFEVRLEMSHLIYAIAAWAGTAAGQLILFSWLEEPFGPTLALLTSQGLVLAALVVTPLQARLQEVVDRLFLRRRADYLHTIGQATDAVASSLQFDQFLDFLFRLIRDDLRVSRVVLLADDGTGTYRACAGCGVESWLAERVVVRGGIARWLATQRQVFVREHQAAAMGEAEFSLVWESVAELDAAVLVPLFTRARMRGILAVGRRDSGEPYSDRDIHLLRALGAYSAVALDNTRLEEQASTDGLTGLAHQAAFRSRLESELQRARVALAPLSVVMVDIDHFKRVNDNFGHQAGDRVILRVVRRLRLILQDESMLGRYGGEEFAIILPDASEAAAACVAERIRGEIEDEQMLADHAITVSVGVAEARDGDLGTDLIEEADRALYAAKEGGRNQVVCASDVPVVELLEAV